MRRSVTWLLFFFLLPGCADVARWMRQYTYPPDFRYIERDQLRSAMWQLAYHTREVNRLTGKPEKTVSDRSDIAAQLLGMEQAAARLDASGWPTNHPLVDMNLPAFMRDVRLARESVQRDPPNYLLAGHVSGACVYCHGSRN